MRRKTFDMILTAGGAMLTVVLLAAGALGLWGHSYATSNVHDQLAMQQITFPALGSQALASPKIGPYLNKYAGQQLLTGPQAEAYADHFIAVHLSEMPYNGVYATASAAAMADPKNTQLAGTVNTIFKGTTLRGLLLEAYAFWTIGQVALVGAIVAFILAAAMLILTALGVWHFRRTTEDTEFPKSLHHEERVPVGV
ncbi:MAG TPA: hypothetical protein VKR22_03770 [Acidimicrobiales bacterium]|nr:hypothetical protein [Acidimicrobiales bacterium]